MLRKPYLVLVFSLNVLCGSASNNLFNVKIFSFLLYFPCFKHDTDLFVNDTTSIVSHQQLKKQTCIFQDFVR